FKPLSPQIALENMAKVIDQKDKYIIIADLEEDKVSALSNTTGLYFSNKNFLEKTRNPDNLKETRNTKTTSEQNINEVVSKIWQNLFGLKNINPDTKFFDLGGDSILATYLFKELEQHFEGLIDISDIFTYPSINSISKYIYSAQKYNDKNIRYKNDSLDDKLQKLKNGELSVSDLENEV
ncbi:acyl carrier protein, partial [Staphylococcus saccharolyticus]